MLYYYFGFLQFQKKCGIFQYTQLSWLPEFNRDGIIDGSAAGLEFKHGRIEDLTLKTDYF